MKRLYTDIDPFCCAVLEARAADGGLPPGDVLRADITALVGGRLRRRLRQYRQIHLFAGIGASPLGFRWAGWPDDLPLLTGGFPCQDISAAGRGAGLDGARSGLFWEMLRAIRVFRAAWLDEESWVFAENVGALSARGLDRVVGALESVGYEVHALRMGAWAVGAPHERERWWVVAHAERGGRPARRGVEGHERQAGIGGRESSAVDQPCRAVGLADLGGRGIDQPGRGTDRGTAARRTGKVRLTHAQRAAIMGCELRPPSDPRVAAMLGAAAGVALGNPAGAGLEGHRADAGQPEVSEPRYAMPRRWPHPYLDGPTPQHDWEPARLHQRGVGDGPDGLPARVADHLNKCGVAALGNAQVPECVEVVARAMLASIPPPPAENGQRRSSK